MAKKRSSKKRRKSGKSRKRNQARRSGWGRRAIGYVLLILALVGLAYVVYLDFSVRKQFEGKRWEVPARVYARPLELYAGYSMTADEFNRELKLMRYRPVAQPRGAGTFSRNGSRFSVVTRSFRFADGSEPSVRARVVFDGSTVASLTNQDTGEPLALLRFDPAVIAGIYPSHKEDRILVRFEDVPKTLIEGLIAVEDRKFHDHFGIDPLAIARALWANLRAGRTVQGGSTLTQQLVKNFFLTNERTLWRKANEAAMALLVEAHYDKQAIFEAYLNEVYLGQDGERAIHGFGLASQFYFQQPVAELDLHQVALLVGLVKGPSYYNPRRHPERARQRRDLVLDLMAGQGVISAQQARTARSRSLGVTAATPSAVARYPAFIDLVRRQLRRDYRDEDLTSEGLRIFTTLDPTVQHHVEARLASRIQGLERSLGAKGEGLEGAVVVTKPENGELVAVVGGRQPGFAGFNRALDAVRPVGSLVKPAVYLTALESTDNYTLLSRVDDRPLERQMPNGRVWAPENYDHEYHGEVPLYLALAHSFNVATARLGLGLGVGEVVDTLRRLGIERPLRAYPSLLLGAAALSPLEVTQMYQTLASGGFRTPLRSIRAVLTSDGQPLSRYPLTVEQAFDTRPVYLLNRALQEVVRSGTGERAYRVLPRGFSAAGKTGTTDDLRDSWFAGFTDDYLAVVWLGADDNHSTGLTGSTGALGVWARIMKAVRARPLQLQAPQGVREWWVDPASGLRTERGCQGAVQLPFVSGTEPHDSAPCDGGGLQWLRRIFQ